MSDFASLEARVACLEVNRVRLCDRVRYLEKWEDTIDSPLRKRLLWLVMGYRFFRLGVWYRARWNESGWQYNRGR